MAAAPAVQPTRTRERLESLVSPSGLFLAAVLMISALPVTRVIQDPDFWWHLRAGQLLTSRAALLGTDPFTYTVASHPWTMHEWLSEVIFAAAFSAAGLGIIVFGFAVVTWLGIVCVLQRARLRNPGRGVLGVGILLGVLAGYPIWGPRVQMITFCFSALTLFMVERHLLRGGRAIWLLVPLFLLWSNLHSGFVIGLGFIAIVLLAEFAGGRLGTPEPASRARLRPLALVLAACTAVSMINPNGPGILLYAIGTQSSVAQQSLIQEWHSPNFHDWEVLAFGAMMLSLAALVVSNRRIRARDAALVLVTTALALQSVRHIALFVAASTPVWIDQLGIAMTRFRTRLHRDGAAQRAAPRVRPQPPLGFRLIVFGLLASGLGVVYLSSLLPKVRVQPDALIYAQDYPVCAARWLAGAPGPLRIFNQYGEGGYLAYALSSRGDRVYIFGDAALMGDALLYQYGDVESVQPSWDSIISAAGTDIVLFDVKTPLAEVMQTAAEQPGARWMKVYEDPHSIAFAPTARVAQLRLPAPPAAYSSGDVCAQLQNAPTASGQNP